MLDKALGESVRVIYFAGPFSMDPLAGPSNLDS